MLTDEKLEAYFKVYKEEEDLILIIFLSSLQVAEDSKRVAQLVEDKVFQILNEDPNKGYKILVDLSLSGGIPHLSAETQKIYSDLAKLKQLQRVAVVGNNTILEAAVNLIMSTSGRQLNFKWFHNLEDAKKWLSE